MTERPEKPEDNGRKRQAKPKPKGMGGVFLIALLLFFLFMFVSRAGDQGKDTVYDFWRHLYNADFQKVTLTGEGQALAVYEENGKRKRFETTLKGLTPEDRQTIQDLQSQKLDRTYDSPDGMDRFHADLAKNEIRVLKSWIVHVSATRQPESARAIRNPDATRDSTTLYALIARENRTAYVKVPAGSTTKTTVQDLLPLLKESGGVKTVLLGWDPSFENQKVDTFTYYLIGSVAPWILIIGLFWFFVIRQMRSPGGGGGVLSFGRSRVSRYNKELRTQVTFDDVEGMDEAKEEVREVIEFLKNPQKFQRLGGRIPRGVLLVGPPGTGKTLLAKAIAGEAEVPFFSISGSDFVEMFVGVGASRVRDLFKQARESSPCIIFLDEIDAVGRKRGSGLGGGHDEREQTLNAILVEMDGFDTDEGIILIGATNRPDVLDPALLRPGRFDRQVVIDMPDVKGREAILRVHARRVALDEADVDLERLARATPGFSGAELASLINEAAILAGMRGDDRVRMAHLEEARDRVRWGREKRSRKMEEEDRRVTAYHEAGHALVGARIKEVDPVHKVTIVSRGLALGATMYLPEKDDLHMRQSKLNGTIAMSYGGRAAEEIVFGDVSAGAQNDIRMATRIARMMVAELGMSAKVGPLNFAATPENNFLGHDFHFGREHSESTARLIDDEVRRLCDEGYERAKRILTDDREILDRIAEALLRFETISGQELDLLVEGTTPEELSEIRRKKTPPPLEPTEKEPSSETLPGTAEAGDDEDLGLSGAEGLATP